MLGASSDAVPWTVAGPYGDVSVSPVSVASASDSDAPRWPLDRVRLGRRDDPARLSRCVLRAGAATAGPARCGLMWAGLYKLGQLRQHAINSPARSAIRLLLWHGS